MRRAVAVLVIAVLCGGCATTVYRWEAMGLEGERCLHRCDADGHRCESQCWGSSGCARSCGASVNSCKAACDARLVGTTVEEPLGATGAPSTDADCWRLGLCGRGECEVRKGRCVRR